MWGELAVSIQSGNGYIFSILTIAFLGMVVILERFIMLQFVFNIDFSKFLFNLRKMVGAKDMDRAINLCRGVSGTSLPRISLRALEAAETDPTTVRGTLEEETIDFLPKLESRLSILPAFATLTMLVGILGTIDALWSSFHSIDVLDTAKKQASLAQGIASSLNFTAIALLTCMGFLTSHQFLKGLATKVSEKIHYGVTVLHNLLVPNEVTTIVASHGPPPPVSDASDFGESLSAEEDRGVEVNDNFDDVAVEDIKDEEEII